MIKRLEKEKSGFNPIKGYLIFIAIIIILSVIFRTKLGAVYNNPQLVKEFITKTNPLGPIVLILLQTLQVIIFIIPGPVFTVAGGYTFGTFLGFFYSLVGTILGSILVFMLAKKYGRPFVEKTIDKEDLNKYDKMLKKRGKSSLFVTRLIPILFPNDVISFAAGLTKMNLTEYIIISFIGFIPSVLLLTYFGDMLYTNANPTILFIIAIIGFIVLGLIWRKPIMNLIKRKRKERLLKK